MRVRWIGIVLLAVSAARPMASHAQEASTYRDCPDCPEMVSVPPGRFRMGLPGALKIENLDIESPQHDVAIAYEFSVGRYEVTVGQFAAFLKDSGYSMGGAGGCRGLTREMQWSLDAERGWRNPGFHQGDDHPVVCVNWADAKAYAVWLSRKTGKAYRLLTEAEWEYAARGGSRSLRPWGEADSDACRYANVWDEAGLNGMGVGPASSQAATPGVSIPAIGISEGGGAGSGLRGSLGPWYRVTHWCNDSYTYTAPVGKYQPNRFGLHDMIGNVWEWVEDCMNVSYVDAPSDGTAWQTGQCDRRVQRGASWISVPRDTRVVQRAFRSTAYRSYDSGFRMAASK